MDAILRKQLVGNFKFAERSTDYSTDCQTKTLCNLLHIAVGLIFWTDIMHVHPLNIGLLP